MTDQQERTEPLYTVEGLLQTITDMRVYYALNHNVGPILDDLLDRARQRVCGRCGKPQSELCGGDFIPKPINAIESAVDAAIDKYGGLRSAARALQFDPTLLSLMHRYGSKNPSNETLRKLGLRKIVIFERLAASVSSASEEAGK